MSITRRTMLALGSTASFLRRASAAEGEWLDFVHLSDPHIIHPAGVHPRLLEMRKMFASTIETLPEDLAMFERDRVGSFVMLTGDLIDVYSFLGANEPVVYNQVEAFARIENESPLPIYASLGNHDVQHYGVYENRLLADQSVVGEARAAWIRHLPCFRAGTYYSFTRSVGSTKFRFFSLDNGFYGHQPPYLPKREGEYSFGRGQLDWFRAQCARYANEPFILGIHIPPSEGMLAELLAALGERKAATVMLTGHFHERDHVLRVEGAKAPLHHVATLGYCNSRQHWRKLRLWEDRVDVYAIQDRAAIQQSISLT